jgi:hypothetical protein
MLTPISNSCWNFVNNQLGPKHPHLWYADRLRHGHLCTRSVKVAGFIGGLAGGAAGGAAAGALGAGPWGMAAGGVVGGTVGGGVDLYCAIKGG